MDIKKQSIGKISINRITSNVRNDYIIIKIKNKETNKITHVEMELEEFALCVTGRSECEAILTTL